MKFTVIGVAPASELAPISMHMDSSTRQARMNRPFTLNLADIGERRVKF